MAWSVTPCISSTRLMAKNRLFAMKGRVAGGDPQAIVVAGRASRAPPRVALSGPTSKGRLRHEELLSGYFSPKLGELAPRSRVSLAVKGRSRAVVDVLVEKTLACWDSTKARGSRGGGGPPEDGTTRPIAGAS